MGEIFKVLVDRYYEAAFQAAYDPSKGTNARDLAATEAITADSGDIENRVQILADWIRLYKVHRVKWSSPEEGNEEKFADAVARAAIDHFSSTSRDRAGHALPMHQRFEQLRLLIDQVYKGASQEDRSFRSLTSKVLWCRYPDEAPIYDRFAVQAVTFLVKTYKASEFSGNYQFEREEESYDRAASNWKEFSSLQKDCWWYRDFCHSHRLIYEKCRLFIEAQLHACKEPANRSYRVFDKVLWIMGNDGLDYSLMHTDETHW